MTAEQYHTLIISHSSQLKQMALFLTHNQHDAEDLVQETFEKALKKRKLFNKGSNFSAWIYVIMRNTFLNDIRKYNSHLKYIRKKQMAMPDYTKSLHFENKIESEQLFNILGNISNNLVAPLKLYAQGFKYEEISNLLDIPIGTVKTRIYNARKYLMLHLN